MDWGIYNEENRKKLASMYIHHVIECFEIYNHEKCNLSVSDKKREIGKILDTEQVKECIKVLDKTNSFYTNLVFKQMKSNRINGIYSIARLKRVLR